MKVIGSSHRNRWIMLLGISFVWIFLPGCMATAKPVRNYIWLPGEEEPVKSFVAPGNSPVKIYTDMQKRTMHVVAEENDQKEVDFFVFDLEGTLVHNYRMKAKDHVKIGGLAKGSYIYRVFCGDNETASGKFDIR